MLSVFFFINSILFGFGLAMDAFSVALANGLHDPQMKRSRMWGIAAVFAVFQMIMPLIGWFCVHAIAERFRAFQKFIPWIALALLLYIGGSMLLEGTRGEKDAEDTAGLTFGTLVLQGIATSIDALSVGFTIAGYTWFMALMESLIIGAVTLVICAAGIMLGRRFGTKLAGKASVLGGVVLIAIGLEIFLTGVL